jgi:hypothetical protein
LRRCFFFSLILEDTVKLRILPIQVPLKHILFRLVSHQLLWLLPVQKVVVLMVAQAQELHQFLPLHQDKCSKLELEVWVLLQVLLLVLMVEVLVKLQIVLPILPLVEVALRI